MSGAHVEAVERPAGVRVVAMAAAAALAACGTPGGAARRPAADRGRRPATRRGAPVKVGLVYSKSGPLATYGAQYRRVVQGRARLRDQGHGRRQRPHIEVTEADDAGDPAKAVAAATDLIGQGQDHRRLDVLGRRPAGRAARQGQQGPLHLRAGRGRRRDGGEQVHLPLGSPDLPGRRHRGLHARRRHRQEGHRPRAGQRLRQGQRSPPSPRSSAGRARRSTRSRSPRPRPT